jgi:hypothetical protein
MAPGNILDRNHPACCAAVESYIHARHDDAHKRKISGARSLINNGWSVREDTKLQASRRNAKRDYVQDTKFNAIEKENMRLLLRMQSIDRRDKDARGTAGKAAAQLLLDAHPTGPTRKLAQCSSLPAIGRGSNATARMREMRRIDDENQRLLKRIQKTRSAVDVRNLEKEHKAQQKVMRMRQEHGPPMPNHGPLPFSRRPIAIDTDAEEDRLQDMHAELQKRLEYLEQQEESMGEEHILDKSISLEETPKSTRDGNKVRLETPDANKHLDNERQYIAGQIPEHSRALVEKMMQEYASQPTPKAVEDEVVVETDHAAEDAKAAMENMLRKARAMDREAEREPLEQRESECLSYGEVVARSRLSLEAARALLAN